MNDRALRHFDARGELLSEREYVDRLYRMRSIVVSESLLPTLGDVLPHWPDRLDVPIQEQLVREE